MMLEGAGTSTVLTGSDVFSAWTLQTDGSYVHNWPYKWGMKAIPTGWTNYWNGDGSGYRRDILRRSEMVYFNGQALRGVLSLSELVAGTFFVNESTGRLHVRLPSGQTLTTGAIEVGMRLTPLNINGGRNVTLKNFAVLRSRGAVQDTGVRITNSRNITLDGMTIRSFAYGAVGTAYNTTVRILRSTISDNGVMALSQFRDLGVLIENSEIARNNARGFAAAHQGWDTVHKWSGIRDGIVRRTRFSDNFGNGFWVDSDNRRITVEYSLMSGNSSKGVSLEKNQGPTVLTGNRICNNGEGGLSDAQSNYVTLRSNQIFNNRRWNMIFAGVYAGQTANDWQTGVSTVLKSLYWTVEGNTVVGSGTEGWLWWHTNYNAPGAWELIRSTFVRFDNNRWYHSGRTNPFTLPGGAVTYPGFVSNLVQSNSSYELNSRWEVPPTLSCTLP
jgi:hypothetical protein